MRKLSAKLVVVEQSKKDYSLHDLSSYFYRPCERFCGVVGEVPAVGRCDPRHRGTGERTVYLSIYTKRPIERDGLDASGAAAGSIHLDLHRSGIWQTRGKREEEEVERSQNTDHPSLPPLLRQWQATEFTLDATRRVMIPVPQKLRKPF
jgi:hypothetical protein